MKKNPPPTPSTQNLKEKKPRHLECMHDVLAACIFYFQNCWSPFLAWAEIEQRRKTKNNSASKEKTRAHRECMLSLPIGCMKIFYFQNCSSPFWAWANTPAHYKLEVLFVFL
jgi:hypothetical protein